MSVDSRKIGSIDCPICGEAMPVKLNGRDTLNISCVWCGNSSYAKAGTGAHKIVSGWIRKDGTGSPDEPVTPISPVAPPAPAAPASSIIKLAKSFSLGEL